MELKEFLLWLATAGGSSIVASFILERIPGFQKLIAEAKQWVYFAVCVTLSISSYAVLNYVPVEILQAVAPYFALIASVFASVFVGTTFHNVDKTEKDEGVG